MPSGLFRHVDHAEIRHVHVKVVFVAWKARAEIEREHVFFDELDDEFVQKLLMGRFDAAAAFPIAQHGNNLAAPQRLNLNKKE